MRLDPFYTALAHLNDFHGITMTDDEFENIALHAFDKIGNKRTRMYNAEGNTIDCTFELPCNAIEIEMVTSNYEDFQKTDNTYRDNYTHSYTETLLEGQVNKPGFFYNDGKMLSYELVGNTLYFKDNQYVKVLYKGELLDENGLPEITVKEKEAIANYCAYTYLYKKGMATRDKATIELAMMLKQEWNRTCENARTPDYLNQNEIDEILQAKNSWDRKRYGVSFKPFRR